MRHVLSEKGIGPAEEKSEAVFDARETKSVTEDRSFLRLANFCNHFIPDLATTAQQFIFQLGREQRQAFQQLKDNFSKAETLTYILKECQDESVG